MTARRRAAKCQPDGGVFATEIVRLGAVRAELRPAIVNWVLQACQVPDGAICAACDARLGPAAASPAAFFVITGMTADAIVAGVCPACARQSDPELHETALRELRGLLPSMCRIPAANIHANGGRA